MQGRELSRDESWRLVMYQTVCAEGLMKDCYGVSSRRATSGFVQVRFRRQPWPNYLGGTR